MGDPHASLTLDEALRNADHLPRAIGQRLRVLMFTVLLGTTVVGLLAHWLTLQPAIGLNLRPGKDGEVVIASTQGAQTRPLEGQVVRGLRNSHPISADRGSEAERQSELLGTPSEPLLAMEPLMLAQSTRWIVTDAGRDRHRQFHEQLAQRMAGLAGQNGGLMQLELAGMPDAPVWVEPRGWAGLPMLFWLLAALGLAVSSVGVLVLLAAPRWRNVAFAALALSQGASLLLLSASTTLGWLRPLWFVEWEGAVQHGLEFMVLASLVQLSVLHPVALKRWPWWSLAAGLACALVVWAMHAAGWDTAPWWAWQGVCLALALLAVGLMTLNHRHAPHPFTRVMRRLTLVSLGTWVLLTVAIGVSASRPDLQWNVSTYGVMTWQVFFGSQLLLSPYLSRSQPLLQEFSLLAASSTVAAALDLLFVAVFALGQFTSMTLALFLSFGVYLGLRRWIVNQVLGHEPISTERLFERLYRMARELERRPQRLAPLMSRLLRELFDPMEMLSVRGRAASAALKGQGGVLVVPMPHLAARGHTAPQVFVLKHADKGRRLFTAEDARLVDRINDQLHRVLTFDKAVEQGRCEERTRLAQDLHDDIGARLLTLMYQAPNADMEEYIRHTLQDLKTLTRGLAVQSHTLVDAAGEWKRDLAHRAQVAHCELDWSLSVDTDVDLTVVQWSSLTRILRELTNNTISHAGAHRLSVSLSLKDDVLRLRLSDDGTGRAPQGWSHGLGLGGVRKRVKQLGGTVVWREVEPRGIACEVEVLGFTSQA